MGMTALNRRLRDLRQPRRAADRPSAAAADEAAPAAPPPGDSSREGPQWERDVAKSRAAVQAILDAPAERLAERDFLLSVVRQMGIPFNAWAGFAAFQEYMNASEVGLIQILTEYVDFLLTLRRRRLETFCEIGATRAASPC